MIDTEGIPADVAAAFAVTDSGRTVRYKRDPKPVVVEREPPPHRPWDVRMLRWIRVAAALCMKHGFIVTIRNKTIVRAMRILLWFWRGRLWVHSARLFLRWKFSGPVTEEVLADRTIICEDCEKWHLRIEPDDPRCEDPKVVPGLYCQACNCPVVERALLKNKNPREGHRCPKGFHEGSKPDPYARQTCSTCGGKKQRSQNDGIQLLPGNGRGGRADIQVPSRRHARR